MQRQSDNHRFAATCSCSWTTTDLKRYETSTRTEPLVTAQPKPIVVDSYNCLLFSNILIFIFKRVQFVVMFRACSKDFSQLRNYTKLSMEGTDGWVWKV